MVEKVTIVLIFRWLLSKFRKRKGKGRSNRAGNLPAKVLKAHFKTLALKRLAKFGKKAIWVATFLRNAFPKDTSECWQILLDAVAEDGNEGHSDAVKALEKSPYDQDLLLRYVSWLIGAWVIVCWNHAVSCIDVLWCCGCLVQIAQGHCAYYLGPFWLV